LQQYALSVTYDHRILRTWLPVRSALIKQDTGGLVVRWVTTSESPLLYVFACTWIITSFFIEHQLLAFRLSAISLERGWAGTPLKALVLEKCVKKLFG
jgi:hypothetical protein